jgi:5-methylcytosine-specific restriction enzyme subunit McrC
MNNVIVIREAYDWLEAGPNSTFTEEDLRELLGYMSQAYPKTEWIELGYNRVRFINVVGTIRLSRVQIDIVPKLNTDKDEGRASLINMLSVCGHVPYKVGESKSLVQAAQMDLLTWLAYTFCSELESQLKRGVPSGYVTIEENSLNLKGRIKVPEHLRYNSGDKSLVYCAFDERTTNIPINMILYKTLFILWRKVRDGYLVKKLQQLFAYFEEVEIAGDVKHLLNGVHFDRQNARFEPTFRLAKLILMRMSLLHGEAKEECFSFLFEVNTLFESYVGKILQSMQLGEHAVVRLQHEEVKLLKNDDSGRENIQLIPDIVLGQRKDDGATMWTLIMDTKWKMPKYQQDDLYQMYAYVTGYREANRVVLLYPRTEGAADIRNWSLAADAAKRIHTRTVRIDWWEHTGQDLRSILTELHFLGMD